jgi:hypothetical protein
MLGHAADEVIRQILSHPTGKVWLSDASTWFGAEVARGQH